MARAVITTVPKYTSDSRVLSFKPNGRLVARSGISMDAVMGASRSMGIVIGTQALPQVEQKRR